MRTPKLDLMAFLAGTWRSPTDPPRRFRLALLPLAFVSLLPACCGPISVAGRRATPSRIVPELPSLAPDRSQSDHVRAHGVVIIDVVDGPSRVEGPTETLCSTTPCVVELPLGRTQLRLTRPGIEPESVSLDVEPVPTLYRHALTLREPWDARIVLHYAGMAAVIVGVSGVLAGVGMFFAALADGTSEANPLAVAAGVTGLSGILTWLVGGIMMCVFRAPLVQSSSRQWPLSPARGAGPPR